jgi:hypothetical protein
VLVDVVVGSDVVDVVVVVIGVNVVVVVVVGSDVVVVVVVEHIAKGRTIVDPLVP